MVQAVITQQPRATYSRTFTHRRCLYTSSQYKALSSTSSAFASPLTLHTAYGCSRASAGYQNLVVVAGNKGATGPFAPLVVALRNIIGTKKFNQLRGKAISLHSQVIKEFGSTIGADVRQVQGLIRLAKKNGEKLGFLA